MTDDDLLPLQTLPDLRIFIAGSQYSPRIPDAALRSLTVEWTKPAFLRHFEKQKKGSRALPRSTPTTAKSREFPIPRREKDTFYAMSTRRFGHPSHFRLTGFSAI